MPAGRPSWTTGMRRTLCSRTIRMASSTDWSTVSVVGFAVQTSETRVPLGSLPAATARTAMFAIGEDAGDAALVGDEDGADVVLGHRLGGVADRRIGLDRARGAHRDE